MKLTFKDRIRKIYGVMYKKKFRFMFDTDKIQK